MVVATKAAEGSTPAVSSPSTTISFYSTVVLAVPAAVTITFAGSSSTLNAVDKASLSAWVKKLKGADSVLCTGFAKNDTALALARAKAVANFLQNQVNLHVQVKEVTVMSVNKVVSQKL